ncbi:unnamed protein product [Ilex paraguariensis]|uniref:Uncharacterized protein n=1 Tax=Ilex paraguariensis TaxID=185542 RepID=A0ABC8QT23_9AQUA
MAPAHRSLDLNAKASVANDLSGENTPECIDNTSRLSSFGKKRIEGDVDHVKSRGFGLDLHSEDVSSSVNHNTFYPNKNRENLKSGDDSECASSIGPLEVNDPMRIWKEMKQNGFLSSSHGGVPMPKPRGRKNKDYGLKKKMELAKREQINRFAKIAAPSGLLNGLNPGIINHVRNGKQVHSIIEALVRSEKLENHNAGSKQLVQTKSGKEESSDRKIDLENLNAFGMSRFSFHHEGCSSLSGSKQIGGCPTSINKSGSSNSDLIKGDGEFCMVERRVFGKSTHPPHSNSHNVTSLSVKAANVASQWLKLLHQDIKGRLTALRRSKKRVQAVIHTELAFLMSREFSSNQDTDPDCTKSSATDFSVRAAADMHQARWSALFDQMEKALSKEEKQLESWLNQVKEMQWHCERGLFQYNEAYGLQHLVALGSSCRLEKADNLEGDSAVRAAAASMYSTCNFLLPMENLPCF